MGKEIAGVGGCPIGCRLTLPFQKPQERLAFFVACQPCLQLTFFPPSPRPALAERSSPAGRGRFFCFLMQGASPLASPGLSPNGTCTTKEFCLSTGAVPVAKERGDRGRGTSAFEMVLSPGAGIASAARVLLLSGTTAAKTIDTSQEAGNKKPGTGHTCRFRATENESGKILGVWGTLSRVPRRFPHHRLCSNSHFA